MSDKLMSITVQGKRHKWTFDFYSDPKYMQEWIDDGLDVVLIHRRVPMWVVELGLTRVWFFFQDVFNFRNPFK